MAAVDLASGRSPQGISNVDQPNSTMIASHALRDGVASALVPRYADGWKAFISSTRVSRTPAAAFRQQWTFGRGRGQVILREYLEGTPVAAAAPSHRLQRAPLPAPPGPRRRSRPASHHPDHRRRHRPAIKLDLIRRLKGCHRRPLRTDPGGAACSITPLAAQAHCRMSAFTDLARRRE